MSFVVESKYDVDASLISVDHFPEVEAKFMVFLRKYERNFD